MEPDECGLEGEVWRIALAACLVARKTLWGERIDWLAAGKSPEGIIFSRAEMELSWEENSIYLSTFVLIVFMKSSPLMSLNN